MAAVLVSINYKVKKGSRDEYMSLARQFVAKVNAAQPNVTTSLFSDEDDDHTFTEIYECPDAASYDALEDSYDEDIRGTISKIAGCVDGRQHVAVLTKRA